MWLNMAGFHLPLEVPTGIEYSSCTVEWNEMEFAYLLLKESLQRFVYHSNTIPSEPELDEIPRTSCQS